MKEIKKILIMKLHAAHTVKEFYKVDEYMRKYFDIKLSYINNSFRLIKENENRNESIEEFEETEMLLNTLLNEQKALEEEYKELINVFREYSKDLPYC